MGRKRFWLKQLRNRVAGFGDDGGGAAFGADPPRLQVDAKIPKRGRCQVLRTDSGCLDVVALCIGTSDDLAVRHVSTGDRHGHDVGPVVLAGIFVDPR